MGSIDGGEKRLGKSTICQAYSAIRNYYYFFKEVLSFRLPPPNHPIKGRKMDGEMAERKKRGRGTKLLRVWLGSTLGMYWQ